MECRGCGNGTRGSPRDARCAEPRLPDTSCRSRGHSLLRQETRQVELLHRLWVVSDTYNLACRKDVARALTYYGIAQKVQAYHALKV